MMRYSFLCQAIVKFMKEKDCLVKEIPFVTVSNTRSVNCNISTCYAVVQFVPNLSYERNTRYSVSYV